MESFSTSEKGAEALFFVPAKFVFFCELAENLVEIFMDI